MKRTPRMTRTLFMLLLTASAIINVAVAWECARWADVDLDRPDGDVDKSELVWVAPVPEAWPELPQMGWSRSGPFIQQIMLDANGPQPQEANVKPTLYRLVTHRVGWPM